MVGEKIEVDKSETDRKESIKCYRFDIHAEDCTFWG